MARTLAIPYKRGELAKISPEHIQYDEESNGRAFLYKKEDFADLLADLRAGKGITTPLWIKPIEIEGGQGAGLVAGQRRLLAALEYVKEKPDFLLPCVWVDPKSERDSLLLNIRENAPRKDLTIIDIGAGAIRLRDLPTTTGGNTNEDIAKEYGVSPAQVVQAIKLVEGLPDTVQRLIHDGKVTTDDALTVLKVPDPTRRQALIEEFLTGKAKSVANADKPLAPVPTPDAAPSARGKALLAGAEANGMVKIVSDPQQPVGQAERPLPTMPTKVDPAPEPDKPNVRDAARSAGAKVALRMPELKKYLQEAIDEDGPGSNKGEVQLKKKFLAFCNGEISSRTIDDWFNKCCRAKGHE